MNARSIWGYTLRLATLLAVAMAFTRPAHAETDNLSMAITYERIAVSSQKAADSAYNSGNYAEACKTYQKALDSYHEVWSYTAADEADPNSYAPKDPNRLHRHDSETAAIYQNMTAACNKANEPPPFDHVAALKDLQALLVHIDKFTPFIYLHDGKLYGCSLAKSMSVSFDDAKLRAHTYLEKTTQAEADKAQINILQIDTNAMRAAKDRDEVYCLPATAAPPPAVAPGVLPAQTAFVTFATEMHLENGLPTKLGSARAHVLFNNCYDDTLQGMVSRGSFWGTTIAFGCGALLAHIDSTAELACKAVGDGQKLLLTYGDAPFPDPEMTQILQIYAQMKAAFKCPDLVVTKSASGIMAIDGKDYIIVKPYPTRPVKAP